MLTEKTNLSKSNKKKMPQCWTVLYVSYFLSKLLLAFSFRAKPPIETFSINIF